MTFPNKHETYNFSSSDYICLRITTLDENLIEMSFGKKFPSHHTHIKFWMLHQVWSPTTHLSHVNISTSRPAPERWCCLSLRTAAAPAHSPVVTILRGRWRCWASPRGTRTVASLSCRPGAPIHTAWRLRENVKQAEFLTENVRKSVNI